MQNVRQWLNQAASVAVLTGAGISAESGIPTFRGAGGLWRDHRPEELATPEAFRRDPKLVWEWYLWRRNLIAKARPNAGHESLVRIERAKAPGFTLITQNVDGLHDRAGSANVLKLHGDIWTMRCLQCGREYADHRTELPEMPPRCACEGMLRPGVVWFGEALPRDVWSRAEAAAASADLFLTIGTSAVVYPAAGLVPLAKRAGARVVEINIEDTPLTPELDCALRGPAAQLLPRLIA